MAIQSISRDWGYNPSIVRILSSDSLATITTTGYLDDQADNIAALNAGPFTWQDSDLVLIAYSSGWGFFTRDADNATFVAEAIPGALSDTLQSGRVFVGSAGNVATGVAMSGDATMANTGALTIANDAVNSAKASPLLIKHDQISVSAADFNGMYVTPKALVAAPGANKVLMVHGVRMFLDYGAAQFAAGGAVHVQYDSTTLGAGTKATDTQAAAGFTGATADTTFQLSGAQAAALASATVNKGLYLSNASAAFTTGDSTFKVDVWYSVADYN